MQQEKETNILIYKSTKNEKSKTERERESVIDIFFIGNQKYLYSLTLL